MSRLTLGEITAACGGEWLGEAAALERTPSFVCSDSRQAGEGCLFIALRGEKTDGHLYIPDVLRRGALAVLCEETGAPGEPRLLVKDSLSALALAGLERRERLDIPFVGVTGSVGKTTAKEMIAAVLGGRYRVFKTPGNLNGQLGVPMCFLNMEDGYEAAVIEMGISQFGEMRRLTEIVRPKIAVFTNIGHAHLEFLGDRDGVLRAKGEILEGMGSDGVVICNGDDDKLRAKDFGCRTVRFGLDPTLDVYAENVSVSPDLLSQSCDVVAGDRRIHVEVPAYGEYMVYAVLAAVAVGLELGLSDEEIRRGALDYEPVGHRSRVKKLRRWTLVDDAYNGNPDANRAAIRSLEGFEGRRVCIMGDMKEMGPESPQMHFDLGRFAGSHGVDLLLSTGGFAPELCAGAGEIGHCFESKEALIAALPGLLREGDVILVKASRSCRFEDIVAAIEAMDK